MVTILQEIMSVYKKKGNPWLDYNEIYSLMDKSLFGPNKHGERGKLNMVYRLILGNPLFDEDPTLRPKKFRLKQTVFEEKNERQLEKVYSTGDTKIICNGKEFEEVRFSNEEDFEQEVKQNYRLIFGQGSVYYDIKRKVGDRICDGFVYDKKSKKLFVIEAEIFIHDLYGHIVPQIIDFFNGIREEKTKQNLKYEVVWNKEDELEIIKAIDQGRYDIVVVIDRITFKIEEVQRNIIELLKHFVKNKEINIIFREFNVFVGMDKDKVFRVK